MDLQKIWNAAKKQIADNVSSISFDLWVKTLAPYSFEDGTFILCAPEKMVKQQATHERHLPHIEAAIRDVAPIVESIKIIDAVEKETHDSKRITVTVNEAPPPNGATAPTKKEQITINPNMTFANFIVGKSNEVVCAAAEAVAKEPGKRINPLFIYGGVGLGKTHLLNAIANRVMTETPDKVIAFVTAEKFTNDYINTIVSKANPTAAFREKYRTVALLLIDDIQFIRDKKSTQEEFFHTFNDLIQNGRQIVITSDRHPDEMSTLEERMRSRFKSGLIQDITTPDVEMRMAILQKKASLENYRLGDEVLGFLANYAVEKNLNIRDMEGALQKVIFYAGLRNKPEPTMDDCHDALKDAGHDSKQQTTADTIINHMCKYFNITRDNITGPRRNREFVEPRSFAMFLMDEFLNIPLNNIGQLLGGRDHTTVMHARDKIAARQKTDQRTQRILGDLSKLIRGE